MYKRQAYSYASEQGLQQKAAAPNPPAETQLADPLSFMAKARWFALGLLGGIFAMIVKLALPTKMSFEQRKQSEWAVWAGFAVNTFLLVVLINTGCLDMLIACLLYTSITACVMRLKDRPPNRFLHGFRL